ncbi:MAG: ketol-acid reductoisomerase [Phycisphaerae bacterium]
MSARVTVIPKATATVDFLREKVVAVLGYGSQGQAHALNLRDSGCKVVVAQRPGGARFDAAVDAGFEPAEIPDAVNAADLLIFGLPDDVAPGVYEQQIRCYLRPGQTLGFMHGFVIHYQQITPPPDVDVVLVAPKAQGRGVRDEFVAGRGVLALIAVHQDATGHARDAALAWAAGIGSNRGGIIETTFRDETETDLFGEQAVLCGGLTALITAGFETLVEAGYPPELAYFECCHEVKLLADLIHEGGITYMRERISSTARFGDLTRGPRLVRDELRREMRGLLGEIQSGQFAREFLADNRRGRTLCRELTERERSHPIEIVGRKLRELMWGTSARDEA